MTTWAKRKFKQMNICPNSRDCAQFIGLAPTSNFQNMM